MPSDGSLNGELSKKTPLLGLKLWVLIGITVGSFIILILGILSAWITFRKRSKRTVDEPSSHAQIPSVSKEIRVDSVGARSFAGHHESISITVNDKSGDKSIISKWSDPDNLSHCSSINYLERGGSSHSGEEGGSGTIRRHHSSHSYAGLATPSPLIGLPEISHLGWGHWFTLRDLEVATSRFSADNVIGEGGYGVVYRGRLVNGTEVAVKKLFNNLGQAEKEFRAEVEAIGHVRHKNLVNLVEWLKMMVGTKRAEEVVDSRIEVKPATRSLKRALVVAIRCVDLEWNQRPRMTQVVRMLEADEFPSREDRRSRKNHPTGSETRPTDTSGSNEIQIEGQQ
ncbi:hypothetical protein SAY86_022620 [Trapa natans]|uniref:non-specific serine/threonine protein kinase n=1 Tax=Trapa natans TaxID=22666 RepID=A0AAN7R8J6_TRANT|nr:hypothetical protein SAY86_022620 [Trapa natans]